MTKVFGLLRDRYQSETTVPSHHVLLTRKRNLLCTGTSCVASADPLTYFQMSNTKHVVRRRAPFKKLSTFDQNASCNQVENDNQTCERILSPTVRGQTEDQNQDEDLHRSLDLVMQVILGEAAKAGASPNSLVMSTGKELQSDLVLMAVGGKVNSGFLKGGELVKTLNEAGRIKVRRGILCRFDGGNTSETTT